MAPSCTAANCSSLAASARQCTGTAGNRTVSTAAHAAASAGSSATLPTRTVRRHCTCRRSAGSGIKLCTYANRAAASASASGVGGMCAPGMPARIRNANARCDASPRRYPAVKSRGHSQVPSVGIVAACGNPRPSSPWQAAQWRWYSACPTDNVASFGAATAGTGTVGPAASSRSASAVATAGVSAAPVKAAVRRIASARPRTAKARTCCANADRSVSGNQS